MVEIALIIYYSISIPYLLLHKIWRNRDSNVKALVVLFIPLFGLPLALLQDLTSHGRDASKHARFTELVEGMDEERIYERVDVRKEVTRISLEEALSLNNLTTRRRILLDVLKVDLHQDVIPLLQLAVSNDDTETSHYAVTAVMEIKHKIMLAIQKWSVNYDNNSQDLQVTIQYAAAIKQYLVSEFMDKRMRWSYQSTYASLLKQLLDSNEKNIWLYRDKIICETELGRLEEALRYCRLFLQDYPSSEVAYLSALNLYYTFQMKESFYETLEALKMSNIPVSNTTLNIIRYWTVKGA